MLPQTSPRPRPMWQNTLKRHTADTTHKQMQTCAHTHAHTHIYTQTCAHAHAQTHTYAQTNAEPHAPPHIRARTQPPLNCHSPSGWATRGSETCAHIAEHGPQQKKKHRRNKNTAQPRGETHRTRGALAVQHAWGHQLRHCIQEKKPQHDHMARHIAQQTW